MVHMERVQRSTYRAGPAKLNNLMRVDTAPEGEDIACKNWSKPEIFTTDQGSQFTSIAFTGLLHGHGIRVSMDGKGC